MVIFLSFIWAVPCKGGSPAVSSFPWPILSKVVVADTVVMVPILRLPGAVRWLFVFALLSRHAGWGLASFGLPWAALVYSWAPWAGSICTGHERYVTDLTAVVKGSVSIRTDSSRRPIFIADSVTFSLVLVADLFLPRTCVESWFWL